MNKTSVIRGYALPISIVGFITSFASFLIDDTSKLFFGMPLIKEIIFSIGAELLIIALLIVIMRKAVAENSILPGIVSSVMAGADFALGVFCVVEFVAAAKAGVRHNESAFIPLAAIIIIGTACLFFLVVLFLVYLRITKKRSAKSLYLFDAIVAVVTVAPSYLLLTYFYQTFVPIILDVAAKTF